ncbi:hypothetical protein [Salinilacihabitans rarus]|uniref:hypothetical protein n=1 Tax=Salinilacihabitans rarus TaxID=2961596 RepID=UPI0020C89EBE|nr:hypothetical protein [Salinilacihabitans rarus]
MVRVRLLDDGPAQYRNRSGVSADEDDPVVDVDDEQAAYLVDETGYFEFVDPDPRLEAAADADASDDAAGDDGGDDPPDEGKPAGLDPSGYTLEELEVELATGDYDDRLDAIEAAERAEKDRDGAYALIDARREE